MLRFFSKIRYKLAAENKTAKYTRYAIGEILLVVIGIMIALQVNNWNEDRKKAIKETYHLQEIKENLNLIIYQLNEELKNDSNLIESGNTILSAIDNQIIYSDTLNRHFYRCMLTALNPSIPNSSYIELRNSGFDLIKSETVRKEIINLYEVLYPKMVSRISEISSTKINPFTQDFFFKHFDNVNTQYTKPNDYNTLIKNQQYINMVSIIRAYNHWFIYLKSEAIEETEIVIQLIEEELNNRGH